MSSIEIAAVLINCASAIALTGVVWVVQLVHYPLFRYLDRARALEAHRLHTRGITPVVAPLMLLELASALALVVLQPDVIPSVLVFSSLLLIAVIWISTFLVQVPLHGKLAGRYDEDTVRWLVASNWIRTAAWSARSVLSLQMFLSLARFPL